MGKRLMGVLILILLLALVGWSLSVDTESKVPAVYLFGDSTLDVGTNNFLIDSIARADKKFYGIDFLNQEPTGRFSNGYNTADSIVKLLGFCESPPPYLYLVNNDGENFNRSILKGVNFASGGAGILDGTGKLPYNRSCSLKHGNISQSLNDTAEATINKSLFLISVGSNDILEFFYFNLSNNHNFSDASLQLNKFSSMMRTTYISHLKNLLNLGARKFGVLSVPAIGCVPIATKGSGYCVKELNSFAGFFYIMLDGVLQGLKSEFPDMKYSLGNSYDITYSIINNPSSLDLSDVASACCGNATVTEGVMCSPEAEVCENREKFFFWDQYHPTEHVSKKAAQILYSGGSAYVAPMNFSLLVQA